MDSRAFLFHDYTLNMIRRAVYQCKTFYIHFIACDTTFHLIQRSILRWLLLKIRTPSNAPIHADTHTRDGDRIGTVPENRVIDRRLNKGEIRQEMTFRDVSGGATPRHEQDSVTKRFVG